MFLLQGLRNGQRPGQGQGHYAQLDSDEYRLPEGMVRIGYDADTETYTYRDSDGTYWEGVHGARYGQVRRVENDSSDGPLLPSQGVDMGNHLKRSEREAWRYMLPFFLLVGVFLLAVYYFTTPPASNSISCAENSKPYRIVTGDTCWSIAEANKIPIEMLREENMGLDCLSLQIGTRICVPQSGSEEVAS